MKNSNGFKSTNFISFMGGINSIFLLVLILLISLSIFMLNTISFVFSPIFSLITPVLTPFLIALIFYYMFVPLVDFLYQHKVPRSIGAMISLVLLIAIVFGIFAYVIPLLITQITLFINAAPNVIQNFTNLLENYSTSPEYQSYYLQIVNWINDHLQTIANQALSTVGNTLQGITNILSILSSILFTLMTFPIFLFFMLLDGRSFKNTFLQFFPNSIRCDLDNISRDINFQVGAYIKGRLIVSFLIFIYYLIVFSIINLPYAFVLALAGGLLSLIPYLGSIISLVPTLIVAFTVSFITVIEVIVIWAFAQILDGNILGPIIIGRNLKMHPLTIIIVLIGFGSLMGVTGMLIGIPIYSCIKIILHYLFIRFKNRYIKHFSDTTY